jgi:ABC-2 type transport system permease protein
MLGPLSILAIITFATQGRLFEIGIIGALMTTLVSGGVFMQADLSHIKNDLKLQDMIVSSPTSEFTYIFGISISELIFAIPTIILLLVLAAIFVHVSIVAAFTIVLAIGMIFVLAIAMGFMFSTFSSDIVQGWGFAGIISTLLTTLPPVFYPITYIPAPYQYLAYLSPTTYAAEIAQNAAGFLSLSNFNILIDWIVLIGAFCVLTYIAVKKARWRAI